ncbi:MAG: beta-N-acetylhexosaminidase [Verrucomicrobiota bacterium]|nr:beta-N-acetylhexosaminidase [Verrucomicrobiota bacterium]
MRLRLAMAAGQPRMKLKDFLPMLVLLPITALGTGPSSVEDEEVLRAGLMPRPAHVRVGDDTFQIGSNTRVIGTGAATAEAEKLAEALSIVLGRRIAVSIGPAEKGDIELVLVQGDSWANTEGYKLSIDRNSARICAATPTGLFYGGITLRQLVWPGMRDSAAGAETQGKGVFIRTMEITDSPRFPWRGLLVDPARHFLPLDFLKKMVDLMSLHKLNTLQIHLTDDQGWRFEVKKYPRLIEIGSRRAESPKRGAPNDGDGAPYGPFFYTQAQMRELVDYARARHVTIVPEIEMPGHFLAALAAYPEFSCTGGPFEVRTRWGVHSDILCAGNDAAVAFVRDVLAEVIEVFPSEFIHIGGDEVPRERWRACPKCQARIRKEGLKNEAQLQTWFNGQIEQFLASRGRRMIGWDEILEGGLTPGAAVMSWRGTRGGAAAAEAGHDVVMSPTSHCYFDYAQGKGLLEPESIGGFIPLAKVYGFDPVPGELPADKYRHVLGVQGNLWSEFMWSPQDVEYFAFPRAAALAEVSWSPAQTRNFSDFLDRLDRHLKRLDQLKVNYRKLDQNDRSGQIQ